MRNTNTNKSAFLSVIILFITFQVKTLAFPAKEKIAFATDYIDRFFEQAVSEMHRSGVPASITLAQGMLETDYGTSRLAVYAKNHFGIKCHETWFGETFLHTDDAYNECFRKYESAEESYADHSNFLKNRSRYSFLFELSIMDYENWAKGLKKAGYATATDYSERLIALIEKFNLADFDKPIYVAARRTQILEKKKTVLFAVKSEIDLSHKKFIIANASYSLLSFSVEYGIELEDLIKYNDLQYNSSIAAGDIIFLESKDKKAKLSEMHIVRKGETLHYISQIHAIQLKYLKKRNNLIDEESIKPGDILALK
jgi:LysM repeat protein